MQKLIGQKRIITDQMTLFFGSHLIRIMLYFEHRGMQTQSFRASVFKYSFYLKPY